MTFKYSTRLTTLAIVISLAGCSSVFENDKIDYKSAGKAPTLEVPPDLTQLSNENRYTVPGGTISANSYEAGKANAPSIPTATASVGDVHMERSGSQRWLVVKRPADQLWEPVRDFWQDNGFLLATEQRNLGIMETDWAENRAKLPQDFIRSAIGKVFDSLYSTGELDRFRTRLERAPNGNTEIFISHRGMVEVYSTQTKDQTRWQPRASDPELETEFLRRLMVKLGVSQEQSKALVAADVTPTQPRAQASTVNGQPVVKISEGFDTAWRRVGLALDRTGFTVEDRNRNAGIYYVRYVPPNPERKDQGFFSRMFSSKKPEAPVKYRIVVKSQGTDSTVSVQSENGTPEASAGAARIVQVIVNELK